MGKVDEKLICMISRNKMKYKAKEQHKMVTYAHQPPAKNWVLLQKFNEFDVGFQ